MLFVLSQINDAKRVAQDTKVKAKHLQDRINNNTGSFEKDKNKTKELIKRVQDYLKGQCSSDAAGTWSSTGGLRFRYDELI